MPRHAARARSRDAHGRRDGTTVRGAGSQARKIMAVFSRPATRPWRPRSSSPPTSFSTSSARSCARAPTSSPTPTATSCACGRTSPCRPAGCISSATPAAGCRPSIATTAPRFAFSRRAPTARTRASSARPASRAFGGTDREQAEAETVAPVIERSAPPASRLTLRIGDLGLFRALLEGRRHARTLAPAPCRTSSGAGGFPRRIEAPRDRSGGSASRRSRRISPARSIRATREAPSGASSPISSAKASSSSACVRSEITASLLGARPTPRPTRSRPRPSAPSSAISPSARRRARPPAPRRGDPARSRHRHRRALEAFERRLELLDGGRRRCRSAEFSAEFGRTLEYYTGFVFEIVSPALGPPSPVAGGGRYDRLMKAVGAPATCLPSAPPSTPSACSPPSTGDAPMSDDAGPRRALEGPAHGADGGAVSAAGLALRKTGNERGYRGEIDDLDAVEVAFISASEIAWYLKTGRAHLGVTGEDLIREQMSDAEQRVEFLKPSSASATPTSSSPCPTAWLDVRTMADLDEIAASLPPRARPLVSRGDEVSQPHAPLLRRPRRHRLPHRREPRRHRGHAGGRHRRPHRRHHDDGRDARAPTACACSTTASSSHRKPTSLLPRRRRGTKRRLPRAPRSLPPSTVKD